MQQNIIQDDRKLYADIVEACKLWTAEGEDVGFEAAVILAQCKTRTFRIAVSKFNEQERNEKLKVAKLRARWTIERARTTDCYPTGTLFDIEETRERLLIAADACDDVIALAGC